jgi:hypothetical protein
MGPQQRQEHAVRIAPDHQRFAVRSREDFAEADHRLLDALHATAPRLCLKPVGCHLLRLLPGLRKSIVSLAVFVRNATRHSSGRSRSGHVAALGQHRKEVLLLSSCEPVFPPAFHQYLIARTLSFACVWQKLQKLSRHPAQGPGIALDKGMAVCFL